MNVENPVGFYTIHRPGTAELEVKKSRFLAEALPVSSEEEAAAELARIRKRYFDARHHCSAYILGEDGKRLRSSDDGEPSGTAGRPILEVLTGYPALLTRQDAKQASADTPSARSGGTGSGRSAEAPGSTGSGRSAEAPGGAGTGSGNAMAMPGGSAADVVPFSNCLVVVTRYFGGTLLGTGGLVRAYSGAAKLALDDAGIALMCPCDETEITLPYSLYDRVQFLLAKENVTASAPEYTDRIRMEITTKLSDTERILEGLRELSGGTIPTRKLRTGLSAITIRK